MADEGEEAKGGDDREARDVTSEGSCVVVDVTEDAGVGVWRVEETVDDVDADDDDEEGGVGVLGSFDIPAVIVSMGSQSYGIVLTRVITSPYHSKSLPMTEL